MNPRKRNTNQQVQSELPFDTPLNPQMGFIIDGTQSDYRNTPLQEETMVTEEETK